MFYPGIQALRAVAAMLVVVEHALYVSNGYDPGANRLIHFGRIGVVLFFAISGFVIALQRTKPLDEFVRHRALRIYPSYWLAMAIEALIWTMIAKPVGTIAAAVLLYPSTAVSDFTSIPYWTLVFEVVFYALAAVAFGFRLSDCTLTVLALLWILAVNMLASDPRTPVEYAMPGWKILLSSPVQVFPMGLLCGLHLASLRKAGRWPHAISALLLFLVSFALAELSVAKLLVMGLSAALAIVAIADLDPGSSVIRHLGDASYGIYLLHFPAIVALATLCGTGIGFVWFLAAGLAAGTLFGTLDHRLYRWMSGRRLATPT